MQTSESSGSKVRPALVLGALGVVYGDIGTSPLYALRECFHPDHGAKPVPENVLGIVSLMLWSLTIIVAIKYLALVTRADNKGEGGILALLSLAIPERQAKHRRARLLSAMAVFGAALLYGDGMLTPAITVLGAIEGLEVTTPKLHPFVVPISMLVIVGLFSVQRFGTGRMGKVFGPIMMIWFLSLALLGIRGIWNAPEILAAVSPHYGVRFLFNEGYHAFVVVGSVFLAVTGAEALYADLGHFGARPIRYAWFAVVFPSLLLNYIGQGGLLLVDPAAARNPFYLLAPTWVVLPLILLATVAAVIASQALISGTYSLTMQAVQMGYLPRVRIRHTSRSERGQVYIPQVNTMLMLACLGLVLVFRSSSSLAGAYGIAVSVTMLITSILFFAAAQKIWHWSPWQAGLVCGAFLCIETAFVLANGLKIIQGGWIPIVVGLIIFTLMITWFKGRQQLRTRLADSYLPLELFLQDLDTTKLPRVPGTAVFMSGNPTGTPIALLHNLRHNQVLHRRIVILTIVNEDIPYVREEDRVEVQQLRPDLFRVIGKYGFMEQPIVTTLLDKCERFRLTFEWEKTTFFLSRETIIPRKTRGIAAWRTKLFAAMSRNAQPATAFFRLPPNRVVELGMQIEV